MPANERILPGLLDRLTAAAPQAQGARSSAAATLKNYQQSVMRDLGWLLNAKAGLDEDVAKDFPEVGRSVLNFGTRDFCGVTASSVNVGEVERELKEAIQLYEPRIISSTLSVARTCGTLSRLAVTSASIVVGSPPKAANTAVSNSLS